MLCCTHFVDLDCIPTTASFTPPTILHTLASYMHLHMYTTLQTYTAVCSQTSGAMHMIATWCHLAVTRAFIWCYYVMPLFRVLVTGDSPSGGRGVMWAVGACDRLFCSICWHEWKHIPGILLWVCECVCVCVSLSLCQCHVNTSQFVEEKLHVHRMSGTGGLSLLPVCFFFWRRMGVMIVMVIKWPLLQNTCLAHIHTHRCIWHLWLAHNHHAHQFRVNYCFCNECYWCNGHECQ